jgi:hypothetical protein
LKCKLTVLVRFKCYVSQRNDLNVILNESVTGVYR